MTTTPDRSPGILSDSDRDELLALLTDLRTHAYPQYRDATPLADDPDIIVAFVCQLGGSAVRLWRATTVYAPRPLESRGTPTRYHGWCEPEARGAYGRVAAFFGVTVDWSEPYRPQWGG
ncbi:MAG TPA: hypothetical protein VD866_06050 [Urbifossiella sp.]|nr:hypothetical protein [Urbifossiella sp.]